MGPVLVRPLVVSRLMAAFVGVAGIPLALLPIPLLPGAVAGPLTLMSLGLSGVVVGRGYRLGVVCRPSELVVRGYIWSRTIEIGSSQAMPRASIRWQDPNGRSRSTVISAFWGVTLVRPIQRHNDQALRSIVEWVATHDGQSPPS